MGRERRSVLIIDKDPETSRLLTNWLTKAGFAAKTALDGEHARSVLERRAFDVLIVDIATSRLKSMDLIPWATNLLPRPKIVAIGTARQNRDGEAEVYAGADLYLEKPLHLARLVGYLTRCARRASFSGSVDDVDIIEYLQFVLLSGKQTILEITSKAQTNGRLFMKDGDVVHAVCGVLEGEEALYRCLNLDGGTFRHLPWIEPEEITIDKPGTFVLMEASRWRDEAENPD